MPSCHRVQHDATGIYGQGSEFPLGLSLGNAASGRINSQCNGNEGCNRIALVKVTASEWYS